MCNQFPLHATVSPEMGAKRLDAFLAVLLPHLGLRARRRLWQWCNVFVNGKPQPQGYMVKVGDEVEITAVIHHDQNPLGIHSSNNKHSQNCLDKDSPKEYLQPIPRRENGVQCIDSTHENQDSGIGKKEINELPLSGKEDPPSLLAIKGDFALFFKPKCLHTATIKGKQTASFEVYLSTLWQKQRQEEELPLLLTRLDYLTSGIILAAKNTDAAFRFRRWEQQGHVVKTYYATVMGCIEKAFISKNALHTAKRKKSVVLQEEDESTRWTRVTPVCFLEANDLLSQPIAHLHEPFLPQEKKGKEKEKNITLVRATISRGARHQIRAHMAFSGHPLTGDPLYGGDDLPFLLHHTHIETPEFSFTLLPDWLSSS